MTFSKVQIILIIFSIIFLGNFFVGPITIRNLLGFGLIIYSLFHANKVQLNRYNVYYFIYLIILIICEGLSGVLLTEVALKGLTYHFICISIILAFPILFSKSRKIHYAFRVLVTLYLVNCLVSILQFVNFSPAWELSSFINPQSGERFELFTSVYGEDGEKISHSILTGMFGFVVTNGYFCACVYPLVTAGLVIKPKENKIIKWVIAIFGLITIYIVQQRMGILIFILYVGYISYKRFQLKTIIIGGIILFILFGNLTTEFDFGRFKNTDDPYRTQIWNVLIEYITSSYFLIGGLDLSNEFIGKVLGHNTILDAFRRGGFVTMSYYIFFYIALLRVSIKNINASLISSNKIQFGLWTSATCYMLYSFTHSSGIQSGDPIFWMLFTLAYYYTYTKHGAKNSNVH